MTIKTRKWITAFCLSWIFMVAGMSAAETTIVSLSSPSDKPLPYKINVSGSFNQWQMNEQSIMSWNASTKSYQFSIPQSASTTLFNVYKQGDWQNPLATEFGKPFTCGFLIPPGSTENITPDFVGWAKDSLANTTDTLIGELITLSDFPMTALSRSGDIYIYLPPGYQQSPDKRYPVAYMLDGQNLFSEATSYSYEWQVDETVTANNMDIIVVGISNGPNRWQEYNPWETVDFSGNHITPAGKDTLAFIKEQLKPHIDKQYRTLTEAKDTALLGSSLGGLMALYAAIEHSDTFGKVAAFSPSFAFATTEAQRSLDPEQSHLLNAITSSTASPMGKIYFDMGEVEYGEFTLVYKLHETLLSSGYSPEQLHLVADKLGRHCELDWARRLPGALTWLFDLTV